MPIAEGRVKRKKWVHSSRPRRSEIIRLYQQLSHESTTGQSFIATNGETEQNISQNTDNSVNNKETEINITKIDANGKQIILPLNARKSISSSAPTKPVMTENEENKTINTDISDKSGEQMAANGGEQPSGASSWCSIHCPGRGGMSPNLRCSRCFCLYHLDCLPGGVFLEEHRVFVCPNCLIPEDIQKSKELKVNVQTNGIDSDMDSTPQLRPKSAQHLSLSEALRIIREPFVMSRSNFAPNRWTPVQPLDTFNKSAAMNVRLPSGTNLNRVATGPYGHSMIIKDKSIKPKVKSSARKTIGAQSSVAHNVYSSQLPYYNPAPIAPIAPIKLTPQQIQRRPQLQYRSPRRPIVRHMSRPVSGRLRRATGRRALPETVGGQTEWPLVKGQTWRGVNANIKSVIRNRSATALKHT